MSIFRKPKKIQRRVFCADEDEGGDPEPPPPPVITQGKKESKKATLLSFADEEEESEVFKVKKSSQSKRLAKKREKERKRGPDGDDNKFDNNVDEVQETVEEKPRKKKVTLEGLILSGREALAADGAGDLSDESPVEEAHGFHTYRADSVRAALAVAPGLIPDAALIHAARKTRQQARELGGDFIPVGAEAGAGGRRDLEGRDDGSGDDDDDEGRILVRGIDLPSDKPKRGTAAVAEEELDSEAEEWEEQQMQKAMPTIMDMRGDGGVEVNPFSLAPPPPPPNFEDAPAHLRPLSTDAHQPPTNAHELVEALRLRLEELRTSHDKMLSKRDELRERLLNAIRVRESRSAKCGELDAAYRRAQAARGYLTDLIECLDEKMPMLETLESRALSVHRRQCEFLVERRRADVRDQAQDVLALAARPGSVRPPDSEEKIRRAAEREGRRRARRLKRESAAALAGGSAAQHRDGDSSDDELPPHERHYCQAEKDAIRQLSASLFADALPAWRGVRGVCARLARFRRRDPALYTDAYIADCLPKLLAPYVRHQLILWNPLADENNEDYEKMDWYKCLMMYGIRSETLSGESSDSALDDEEQNGEVMAISEQSVHEDPDLYLVPTIVNKVVLPKLTELVEHAWDPMSVRACVRLRHLVVGACAWPTARATPALQRLAAAITARLSAALNADVFLPALPPNIMETSGGAFWRRCLGAGVRLLRAILALTGPPALLYADPLVLSLIETLSCGAGAAPAQFMAQACVALAETLPRAGQLRARALKRLSLLAQLAISRLQTDNPLHLKALEQARSVIAESRAAERD